MISGLYTLQILKPRALSCTSRALSCTGRALGALDGFDAPGTFLITLNLFSESFIRQEPRKNCLDDFLMDSQNKT